MLEIRAFTPSRAAHEWSRKNLLYLEVNSVRPSFSYILGISGLSQKAQPVCKETAQTFIQALSLKCLGTWKQHPTSSFRVRAQHLLLLFFWLQMEIFCPDLLNCNMIPLWVHANINILLHSLSWHEQRTWCWLMLKAVLNASHQFYTQINSLPD